MAARPRPFDSMTARAVLPSLPMLRIVVHKALHIATARGARAKPQRAQHRLHYSHFHACNYQRYAGEAATTAASAILSSHIERKPPLIGGLGGRTLNPKRLYVGWSGAGIQVHSARGLRKRSPATPEKGGSLRARAFTIAGPKP